MTPDTASNIIAAVQIVFAVALLPTVLDRCAQVPRASSGITAAGLWLIGGVYVELGLISAAACAGVAAAMWTFILLCRPVRHV